ncbi:hypothetical protein AKUG0406_PLPX00230 (plasmid) [Apilactobacillus kunkeei]|nr:hypothetical protein AKUG0406_PLPX00230 [Apilactobacillus kunkeei]CAI2675348.1 hypothetical protein AKUG0403_PLPX00220 [Apilactobacillus kunkeei]CAI2677572.1 hypothetical protein AKUH3B111A_PLPX00210 [Apilactobacillus kunkeei]CAI2677653.1 hypothetical protein AKUH3B103M_PLPX00220 [Apilactobacillus kunkeei]CAI2678020.1 hypothetical protein AKUH3B104X_PLPX00220 [Apilactobacillus kunkeei]
MNSNEWIKFIFKDVISEQNIKIMMEDFEKHLDDPLEDFGVTSLSLLEIVLNIEKYTHKPIDINKFNPEKIRTLRLMKEFINE